MWYTQYKWRHMHKENNKQFHEYAVLALGRFIIQQAA